MLKHHLAVPALLASRALRTIQSPAPGFRILLLHDVPGGSFDDLDRLVCYLKDAHGILSPEEAESWLTGRETKVSAVTGRNPCLLSFDDGFVSNYDLAVSVLERHDLKALFFICPGLVDLDEARQREAIASNIFDGHRQAQDLAPSLRLMNWDQIRDLRDRGHTIGCHGLLHNRLSRLEPPVLEREILEAGDLLDDRLGEAVSWYAYAFGDINSISRSALEIIGQRFAFCRSGIRGANSPLTNRLGVLADEIDIAASSAYWKLVAEGALDVRYRMPRRRLNHILGAGADPIAEL